MESPINRLVMINPYKCMLCHTVSKDINYVSSSLTIGHGWGWLYCKNCKDNLRKSVLAYIDSENVVPCNWLINSERFNNENNENKETDLDYLATYTNKSKFFNFKDDDGKILTGGVDYFSEEGIKIIFDFKSLELGMRLIVKNTVTDKQYYKFVSLVNIFTFNPHFYEELCGSTDLVNSNDAKIGFNDLPEKLRKGITNAFILSIQKLKYK